MRPPSNRRAGDATGAVLKRRLTPQKSAFYLSFTRPTIQKKSIHQRLIRSKIPMNYRAQL
jgi:hypothetical protein